MVNLTIRDNFWPRQNQEPPIYEEQSINTLQHVVYDEDQALNIIQQGTT
jgi:hypothetical protein